MSYNETMHFEEGLRLVQRELEKGSPAPKMRTKELPLDAIRMRHSVFQPREFEDTARSEDHVRALVDAIKIEPGNRLDPITVWWSGKHWTVLNGHHRVLAYARARKSGFKQHQPDGRKTADWMVPVRYFEGTLQEALIEATRTNSKNQLSMTKDEKLNRGWRLTVLFPELSKAQVAGACKISPRTVANMRSQLKVIKADYPKDWQSESLALSWKEAQRWGKKDMEFDESWQDKLALEWSKRLGKTFGTKLAEHPEIAAHALSLYSERLTAELGQLLHIQDEDEDDECPDF